MKKKFLFVAFAFVAMFGLVSCGGKADTPEAAAEKYMDCIKGADWEGMLDLAYFDEKMSDEEVANAKKIALPMFEVAGDKKLKEKDGIKDYEVKDVDLNKDEDKATVEVKVTYGDGSKDTERVRVVKTDDEGWKVRLL